MSVVRDQTNIVLDERFKLLVDRTVYTMTGGQVWVVLSTDRSVFRAYDQHGDVNRAEHDAACRLRTMYNRWLTSYTCQQSSDPRHDAANRL